MPGTCALERVCAQPLALQDGDCGTPGERSARVCGTHEVAAQSDALPVRSRARATLRRARRAAYLSFVVERAKKCLDFTLTLYIIHLACCCAYRGWPRSPEWWALNLTSAAVMAALGEWLCLRKEMREIPISSGGGGGAGGAPAAARGRSGSGGGGVQMVGMQRTASE